MINSFSANTAFLQFEGMQFQMELFSSIVQGVMGNIAQKKHALMHSLKIIFLRYLDIYGVFSKYYSKGHTFHNLAYYTVQTV